MNLAQHTSSHRRRYWLWRCTLAFSTIGIATFSAQPQEAGRQSVEVRFRGATRTSESYIRGVIRTSPERPFDQGVLDDDVIRLLQTGKFLSVTADTQRDGDHVVVTFQLLERPLVAEIRFVGNTVFGDAALRDKVTLRLGDPIDLFAIRQGRDNIVDSYREKGFGYTKVAVDEQLARTTGSVVFEIEEGPLVRVRRVLFEGNRSFTERQLKKHVRTRSALWIFRTGAFDPTQCAVDAAQLQKFLQDEGFLDARVSYRVDTGARSGDLNIVFTILEGRRYRIETIRIEGNTVAGAEEILSMMDSSPEDIVKLARLESDIERISTFYQSRGYIYAQVRPLRVFSVQPGYVILTVRIDEGEPYSVGRIVIRGNQTTQDKVVRRALDLFPVDTFDLTLAREAERDLRDTQIFDRASVLAVGNQPNERDIIVDVLEADRVNDLIFGFGVTSNSGLVGTILLDLKNFDLTDTPRTFGELIRLRAFRGAGQRLRLSLQPGSELNRFRLDFTEPYLNDWPIRFDFGAYHFTRSRDGYDEKRTGTNVSLGRRLTHGLGGRGWFRNWYGELSFRAENVDLDDIDIFDDRSVRDAEGDNFLTSVKGTLVRDRTDNRFVPSTGDRLTLGFEQFVGDFNFGKLRVDYARHHTIQVDALDRKSVFSWRVDTGFIIGDAPVFEKFYAGGVGSIRGFDFRGVGPRGGLRTDPIGGEFLLTTSAEYSFPLAGEVLRGVFFADMGTVEESAKLTEWRVAIGAGIRMTIQLLGPVPIELDVAIPIVKGADDDEQVFSFFVGGTF